MTIKRYMKPVRIILTSVLMCGFVSTVHADIASVQYVQSIISSLTPQQADWNQTDTTARDYIKNKPAIPSTAADVGAVPTSRTVNGHALSADVTVTKADVGLGNVPNVDTTNASNITSGTMDIARLPVGTTSTMVAIGNDARFDTVSTTQPSGTPPTGTVFVWFD